MVHWLAGRFSKISAAILEFEDMNQNTERFNKVEGGMSEILKCSKEIHQEMKDYKANTLTSFFLTVTSRTVTIDGTISVLPSSSTSLGAFIASGN